ncbi:GNAT family N-acetyltransferase [Patescibacteria group bacterium]|nr:GNAT family N-acetyltransferase [Patescibacteria group bacterium]MBU1501016.1 GNAT family N-acetyltransferase [Patescibacteria group bacterium]MBU2080646.1 GNAT family N-acetyltransferase [Patescibacteria group bacterium]MBU2124279.1 GNAT family N-acetyltransferase [Patescibacteria group bacterium]MBU2194405.1 GNAT family N-acetyltransferase [Patescibacteria group bacterium]
MSEKHSQKWKSAESEPLPVPILVTGIDEIREYTKYADSVFGVDESDPTLERWTPEYIATHTDTVGLFVAYGSDKEIKGGGLVTILSKAEALEKLFNQSYLTKEKIAIFEYQVVREEDRRKGLARELTEKRLQWAREHGATLALSEIETVNPISAHAKTREGFVFIGIQSDEYSDAPLLVAVKPLVEAEVFGESIKNTTPIYEHVVMSVKEDSHSELDALFREGWIGIDAQVGESEEEIVLTLRRAKLS